MVVFMGKCLIMGVAGGTGSGKTTFTKRIKEAFPNNVVVIKHDDYYKPQDHLTLNERKTVNYDHPRQLDTELLIEHLMKLKDGYEVECPQYDFSLHTRASQTKLVRPTDVIIVEGILIFADERLKKCFDLKIFVETDADERILRRIQRDLSERGRDIDGIIEQYLSTVKPMHNTFVEPTKAMADMVINGGMNDQAFDLVRAKIASLLV